jgi:hypothetical protein
MAGVDLEIKKRLADKLTKEHQTVFCVVKCKDYEIMTYDKAQGKRIIYTANLDKGG